MKISIIIMIICFTSICCVSAANQTDEIQTIDNQTAYTSPVEEVSVSAEDTGNFSEIQSDVDKAEKDSVVLIEKNHTGQGTPIKVSKSITIEGKNNAVLDAKKKSSIIIVKDECTLTLKDLTFKNAVGSAVRGELEYNPYYKLILINCTFINNQAENGGAVSALTAIISGSTFTSNRAKFGGAVDSENIQIRDSTFTSNRAEYGGAIYCCNEDFEGILESSNFTGNYATRDGGAIYDIADIRKLKVTGCEFKSNRAGYFGGAITSTDAYVKSSKFLKNHANYDGGAVYIFRGSITGCEFADNSAYYSGAVRSEDSSTIKNCKFTNNTPSAVYSTGITLNSFKTSKPIVLDNSLKKMNLIKLSAKSLSTYYKSSEILKITAKVINNKPVKSIILVLTFKNSKKTLKYPVNPDKNGVVKFRTSKLPAGTYTLKIKVGYPTEEKGWNSEKTVKVKIAKSKTVTKAPKVTGKFKKSKLFTVTVKQKNTKKPVSNLKLKVKVYTGKKFKTYSVKTNKNGIAKFNTKKLSKGNHRVVVSSANSNYSVSKKSAIKIR